LAARLLFWGRVPRYLFAPLERTGAEKARDAALSIPMERLATAYKRNVHDEKVSNDTPHRYIMEHARGEEIGDAKLPTTRAEWKVFFSGPSPRKPLSFTSVAWEVEAALAYYGIQQQEAARLSLALSAAPVAKSMRGSIFEIVAEKVLSAGGKFDIRELGGSKKVFTATVTPGLPLRWWDADELSKCIEKDGTGQLIASKPNQAAVDTLCRIDAGVPGLDGGFVPINFTVAADHDIKINGVLEVAGPLGWDFSEGKKFPFVFAVPSTQFQTWTKVQKLEGIDDGASVPDIKQYVLCVPINVDNLSDHLGDAFWNAASEWKFDEEGIPIPPTRRASLVGPPPVTSRRPPSKGKKRLVKVVKKIVKKPNKKGTKGKHPAAMTGGSTKPLKR